MSPTRVTATGWLGALAVVLALALAWVATGAGTEPSWLGPGETATDSAASGPASNAQPAVNADRVPPPGGVETLANTWQAPLFSPSRKPDPPPRKAQSGVDLDGLKLTGIVLADGVRRALFKQADGKDLQLREGGELSGGWRLQHIENRAVQFEMDGRTQRLQLPAPRLPDIGTPSSVPPEVLSPVSPRVPVRRSSNPEGQ